MDQSYLPEIQKTLKKNLPVKELYAEPCLTLATKYVFTDNKENYLFRINPQKYNLVWKKVLKVIQEPIVRVTKAQ